MTDIQMTVNGTKRVVAADPEASLLLALRNDLGLVGSRFGCGLGQCGACFVLVDGAVTASCDTPMWSIEGKTVVTVEGLAEGADLHRVQQAVLAEQAAQCGYCLSGVLVSAAALMEHDPHPDEPAVIGALERNLCRCGAHRRMVRAVARAGRKDTEGRREEAEAGAGGAVDASEPRFHRRKAAVVDDLSPPRNLLPRNLVANPVLSSWISVRPDGRIGLRVGKVEFGQGILTALAQLAADELDVDLAQVEALPANTVSGPDEGLTSGSRSIADSGSAVQLVAANVRACFVRAAADRWQVDVRQVSVVRGRIAGPLGQSLSYAELTPAVDLDSRVDPSVPVKAVADARFTGTSVARLDLPDKVAGRPRFIHDLRLPGQLFGRVVRPPGPGAHLIDVAENDWPGVQVIRDGSFLAVVGPDETVVSRATERLRAACTWQQRDTLPDENDLDGYLRTGPHETITVIEDSQEDAAPETPGGRSLHATYSRPFIAHASIAPSCAVARWPDDGDDGAEGRVQVWSHSQGIHNLRAAIAAALELDPASVTVEHAEGAGCYGHNAADDAAFDAVLIARAVPGHPVQVLWSRADELSWAPFGSAMTADVSATLDRAGRLTSWRYEVFSQGHTARPGYAGVPGLLAATTLAEPAVYPAPTDPPATAGAGTTRNALPGYDLPHRRVVGQRKLTAGIRSSAIRALGAHLNVFAIESFMDEAALLADVDPLAFRLDHLSDQRGRQVLQTVARAASWGSAVPEGVGRGLGYAQYKGQGAHCAVVAEVEADHEIRVRRLTIAIDVGRVVNPDGVRNQIEGGATQATSWTLKERVRFDRRRVTSTDWESYPILRFSEAPALEVVLVENPEDPSVGAGEAAQGPTAAAIGNAVAAAIGVRVRDLPITPEAVIAAINAE